MLSEHETIRILANASLAAVLNKPHLLEQVIRQGAKEGVSHTALYEALLQTYLFAGFPAALEGLSVLAAVAREFDATWYQQRASTNTAEFHTAEFDALEFTTRGETLCKAIYTTAYTKMRQNLAFASPELSSWMILEGYGKTLSREGLPPKIRELLIVVVLAALGWKNQLYSHIRGALNVGASAEECRVVLLLLTEPTFQEQHSLASMQQEALQMLDTLAAKLSSQYKATR